MASDDGVRRAIEALDRVRADWHRVPGVTATDVGREPGGAGSPDTLVIRVHVKDPGQFDAQQIPPNLAGIPIRIIRAGYGPAGATGSARDPGR